jgi:2-polyprenyl-3-methyl-5-hydroxy-6-metoxy-1,4-benzoquinol methylase
MVWPGLDGRRHINRTLKSFALAIVGAEYVLGWLPRGHRWDKWSRRTNSRSRWSWRGWGSSTSAA